MAKSTSLAGFVNELEALDKNTVKTSEDVAAFNAVRSQLLAAFPEMASKLGGEVSSVDELGGAYQETADAIWEMNEALEYQRWMDAHEKAGDATGTYNDARDELTDVSIEGGVAELRVMKEAVSGSMQNSVGMIMQMAAAIGFAGESIDGLRMKTSAYIDEQQRIKDGSALWSPEWWEADSNIKNAQAMAG